MFIIVNETFFFLIFIVCSRLVDCLIFFSFYIYIELIWLCNILSSWCLYVNEYNCSILK